MKKLYSLFLLTSFIGFAQNPGDLVITEIMKNPVAVSDADGEWFELYNTTGSAIDINGWTLTDNDTDSHIIDNANGTTIVPANGYLVLGKSTNMATNGGAPVDYAFGNSDFFMANGADEVVLTAPGNNEISRVNYTGTDGNFPNLIGESMQLKLDSLNETDNDNGDNWCPSASAYGDGDLGTPGAVNEACPITCSIEFGAFSAVCDNVNPGANDDTYTATLDFSGGNIMTTVIVSASQGVVSGDDPSNTASGTIIVTGITEGTDVTITLDDTASGGICTESFDISSPICIPVGSIDLEFVGILDLTVPSGGSDGKAIHVVATADIADLSVYGIGTAANGGGSDGQEYTFDAISVNNGDHILVARTPSSMEQYLTTPGYNFFNVVLTASTDINMNGNDGIELFKNGTVIETFGDVNVDGTGLFWEYDDSWAYKETLGSVWPSGWIYGGVDCTNGTQTTFDSTCVYPFVESLSTSEFSSNELSIYPNPVNNGLLYIKSHLEGEKSIKIFDVMGRKVRDLNLSTETLDVRDIKSGIYILRVSIANRTSETKLIIK